MQLAFERLSDEEQVELMPLRTVNTFSNRRGFVKDEDLKRFDHECIHPLIRSHPDTGKKAIYVHWNQMDRLEGRESEPSRAYIKDLLERVITPEICYRHKWRLGDLMLVDNQGAMHKAMVDYEVGDKRILHRVMLEGGVPFQ
jgi:taurine dioxygenase